MAGKSEERQENGWKINVRKARSSGFCLSLFTYTGKIKYSESSFTKELEVYLDTKFKY